jgi:hypothetical protein
VAESDWLDLEDASPTLHELLSEIGRVYVPFLLANAAAVEQSAQRVECRIDGEPWMQDAFPYQAKCLRWLRERHAALPDEARARVARTLAGTGCEALLG